MPRTKLFDEDQVLKKAVELFWKSGYHATSMQDLVDHLGVNRASLYSTYGDKKNLFQRAFQNYQQESLKSVKGFLAAHDNVKEGLCKLMKRSTEQTLCDPDRKGCFAVNTTTELVPNDPEMSEVLRNNQRQLERVFEEYMALGVERGQIDASKDLSSLSAHLFTFYSGLQVISKTQPDSNRLDAALGVALSVLD